MTRARRREMLKRHSVEELTFDQRYELDTGDPFIERFDSIEHLQEAWMLHRDAIREEFIRENPGQRPFAEWLFELVPRYGERLVTDDFVAKHRKNWEKWGILHTSLIVDADGNTAQEAEHVYLDRHGLLEDWEREVLTL